MMRELKVQNEHLSKVNGRLEKHDNSITKMDTTLYSKDGICDRVGNNTKTLVKMMIAVAVLSAGVGGGTYGLIQALI
jgi:hypothetical protein